MRPRIRPLDRPNGLPPLGLAALALLLGSPSATRAQLQDARQPASGTLWFELAPAIENWSDQFALDSPDDGLSDGDREPLFRDFDGPIASRLFPSPQAFLDALNADAPDLGFAPLSPAEFSLGAMEFGTINAQRRRIELGIELGILDRVSFEARAPLVFTEVEAGFRYDSASATVFSAPTVFTPGSAFFTDFETVLADLQALIDGGTLDPAQEAAALALRDGGDAFLTALAGRATEAGLLPTALTRAGVEMRSHVDSLAAEFEAFGLTLPDFALADIATSAGLGILFEDPPVSGMIPGSSEEGWSLGEVELGIRLGLVDGITPEPGGDGAADGSAGGGTGLRTTIGARLRLPSRTALRPTAGSPADFIGLPISDGQRDVELALYQDLALGDWLILNASGRYGIQLEDELRARVRPPDRPFAFASTLAAVRRDLGDYVELRIAPRLRLTSALSLGLEYGLWRKGADRYELLDDAAGVADAGPLELETRMTRHRVGIGAVYDLSEAEGREEIGRRRARDAEEERAETEGERPPGEEPPEEEAGGAAEAPEPADAPAEGEEAARPAAGPAGIARPPWRFAFTVQRAIAGSGGQTPASFLVAVSIRAPVRIF